MTQTTRRTVRAPAVRDTVENVWLAGLGALARAEEEGGRLFRTLVERGTVVERGARARLRRAVTAAREVPNAAMADVENRLDDAVSVALHRLGVPTEREMRGLARRIEGLAIALERKTKAAKPKAARKAARPKTTRPKTRSKTTKRAATPRKRTARPAA